MAEKDNKDILTKLFKRLEIVLYKKFDERYPNIESYEELQLSDL